MKTCTKCGIEYEATIEFFTMDKRRKDGLGSSCRVCDRKRFRDHYKNNKEHYSKKCKLYYYANWEVKQKQHRQYYKNNLEESKGYAKEYNKKHKEKNKKYQYDYHQNKMMDDNYVKRRRENNVRWAKENPIKNAIKYARRRAMKLNQTPTLTQEEKYQIEMIYKKSQELGKDWHVDHIRPLSKGGLHHPNNLQIVQKKYNLQKSDKLNFRLPTSEEIYNV